MFLVQKSSVDCKPLTWNRWPHVERKARQAAIPDDDFILHRFLEKHQLRHLAESSSCKAQLNQRGDKGAKNNNKSFFPSNNEVSHIIQPHKTRFVKF